MKWILSDCSPGDMIRIRVGAIWHYGVYCADDEVIEFGDAPLEGLSRDAAKIFVKRVSVDEFSAGRPIEVASLDRTEKKKRIPPKKTVQIARSRIGEGGYDLLKNNCEHFANECVFGRHFCSMEEEAREKWRERQALDVYLADSSEKLPDAPLPRPVLRSFRRKSPEEAGLERFLWNLFFYAASKSFGYEPNELKFRKNKSGGFTCEKLYFSFSLTEASALVAVSHEPVGIFAKELPAGERGDFYSSVEEGARKAICAASDDNLPCVLGICEGKKPICLAAVGNTARATLVWRCTGSGRTLQKLLSPEQVISL